MLTMGEPSELARALAVACTADGEFALAARYWDGSLRLCIGDNVLAFIIAAGKITAGPGNTQSQAAGPGAIRLAGPLDVWEKLLATIPPPMFNDIVPAAAFGLMREGEDEIFWQYYPAVRRLIDLLREEVNSHATV